MKIEMGLEAQVESKINLIMERLKYISSTFPERNNKTKCK